MLGFSADLKEIKRIAKKKRIRILEDNCESIGGKFQKKYLGMHGNVVIFSLYFGKIITTGEGGLILTNDRKIFDYCKQYHDHGHLNVPTLSRGNDRAKIHGFNYRVTELQGAIGKVQLKKLKTLLSDNKKKYNTLKKY